MSPDPQVHVLFRPFSEKSDASLEELEVSRFQLPAGGFACFQGKAASSENVGAGTVLLPAVYRDLNTRLALFHLQPTAPGSTLFDMHETPRGEGFSIFRSGIKGEATRHLNVTFTSQVGEAHRYPVYTPPTTTAATDRLFCIFASMASRTNLLLFADDTPGLCAMPGGGSTPPANRPSDFGLENSITFSITQSDGSSEQLPIARHNDRDDASTVCSPGKTHGFFAASDTCYLAASPYDLLGLTNQPSSLNLSCLPFTQPDGSTCYEPVTGCHDSGLGDRCPPAAGPGEPANVRCDFDSETASNPP